MEIRSLKLFTPKAVPIRRISIPLPIEDHGLFILQTEQSLQFVHDTLWWLLCLLIGGSTTLILFAWWGSDQLAREALAPVETFESDGRNDFWTNPLHPLNPLGPL